MVPGVSDRVCNPQKREVVVTIPSISRKLIQFARNALKICDPSNERVADAFLTSCGSGWVNVMSKLDCL